MKICGDHRNSPTEVIPFSFAHCTIPCTAVAVRKFPITPLLTCRQHRVFRTETRIPRPVLSLPGRPHKHCPNHGGQVRITGKHSEAARRHLKLFSWPAKQCHPTGAPRAPTLCINKALVWQSCRKMEAPKHALVVSRTRRRSPAVLAAGNTGDVCVEDARRIATQVTGHGQL